MFENAKYLMRELAKLTLSALHLFIDSDAIRAPLTASLVTNDRGLRQPHTEASIIRKCLIRDELHGEMGRH